MRLLRFINPGEPAGRLEFFAVNVLLLSALIWANVAFLGFAVTFETAAYEYQATAVTTFFTIYIVVAAFFWLNVLRRLKDLRFGGSWSLLLIAPLLMLPLLPIMITTLPLGMVEAVVIGLPVAQVLFILFLTFSNGVSSKTYAPYGDDPLDPNSWVPRGVSMHSGVPSGTGVSFNGQEMRLPGEKSIDEAA